MYGFDGCECLITFAHGGNAAPPLPPDFLRECRRMIVDASYRVGDFPRARATLRRWQADADGEAEHLRAQDAQDRIAWAERARGAGKPVAPTAHP